MRHRKSNNHMNRTSEHVRSMVRNMVVNLLRHERIRTTVKKAKLVRPYAEKMITLGKRGTLHARRQALAFLRSKPAVVKLFRNVAHRYSERNGGYTRVVRLAETIRPATSDKVADFKVPAGTRLGDGTSMAILELVEGEVQPRQKRRGSAPEPFRPRREFYRQVQGSKDAEEAKAEGAAAESAAAESAAAESAAAESAAAESAAAESAAEGAGDEGASGGETPEETA